MSMTRLHHLLDESAAAHPTRVAVEGVDGRPVTYAALARMSDRARDMFLARGVAPGDRVAICLPKSVASLALILGVSKAGGIYVPVDAHTSPGRMAAVIADCAPRVLLVAPEQVASLEAQVALDGVAVLAVDVAAEAGLEALLGVEAAPEAASASGPAGEAAYILYTSGSTGRPKGVVHTHESGLGFVAWASAAFEPTAEDRFASHAPFHFDLSILDLFVPLRHGATVCLVGETLGRNPFGLGAWIAERRISVWYSVPTILRMMADRGKLECHDVGALRLVLFAGEVFPPPDLRRLQAFWPKPRYCNLFGPTETNVCTWYTIPGLVEEGRTEPFPIGPVCDHLEAAVVMDGSVVADGDEGELCVRGPSVMAGYWGREEATREAFCVVEGVAGWYLTGDYVKKSPEDGYLFLGRRDRMVKRRGYRIQLGEIEARVQCHPELDEAAVVSAPDAASGVRITAVVACDLEARPSLIAMKRYCAEGLPRYMIPDRFVFVAALPRTSTGKMDYTALRRL